MNLTNNTIGKGTKPTLEIHVPISPTPKFLRMARCLALSLRHLGGAVGDTRLILTIGDTTHQDAQVRAANPWLDELAIETRWVPETLFAQDSYYATANQRFCYKFESDMVLMLDADMLVARPFDDLVSHLYRVQKLGGVLAYASPFDDAAQWQKMYSAAGLGNVKRIHEHPGWPYLYPERSQFTPPYFNLGFLLMPADFAEAIGGEIFETMHQAAAVEDTQYKCQLALSLAVTRLGIPYECLPLRYNFANNRDLEALHGGELPYATILHMIWKHQGISKDDVFGTDDGICRMLERTDLRGINRRIQEVLSLIVPEGQI